MFDLALILLLIIRSLGALYYTVNDCDEIFNYWEPIHHAVFGTGFQTWEYAPHYALRTWLYIELYASPIRWLRIIFFDLITKRTLLILSKLTLVNLPCVVSEVFLVKAWSVLCKQEEHVQKSANHKKDDGDKKDNKRVIREDQISFSKAYLIFAALSSGMFISAGALLPSSFFMILTNVSTAYWIKAETVSTSITSKLNSLSSLSQQRKTRYFRLSVFFAVTATLVSAWPFGSVVYIPFFIRGITKFGFGSSLLAGLFSLFVVAMPIIYFDQKFFGTNEFIFTPWNTFKYNNPFAADADRSKLYGVEPWHYYIKNLVLNFHLGIFFMAMAAWGLLVWIMYGDKSIFLKERMLVMTVILPAALWVTLLSAIAHKEERFLYVIHPHLCLIGGFGLQRMTNLAGRSVWRRLFVMFLVFLMGVVSMSRILALHLFLGNPVEQVWQFANDEISNRASSSHSRDKPKICIGESWYRFPSHFFIDDNLAEVEFVKSEFNGQLPAKFGRANAQFNNENKESLDRYVQESECNYRIGSVQSIIKADDMLMFDNNIKSSATWKKVNCAPLVDLGKSKFPWRSFYLYGTKVDDDSIKLVPQWYCLGKNVGRSEK